MEEWRRFRNLIPNSSITGNVNYHQPTILQNSEGRYMNSSSSNYSNSVYGNLAGTGAAPPSGIGMGSLQNLNRSGSSLAQLSRAAIPSASPSSQAAGNPGSMGFNSAVGGGRITPTSVGGPSVVPSVASSFNSAVGSSGFPSGFGSSQQPQLSRQLGILQSTNSMPSASVVTGRNPLFSRDRGKMDSLSAFDPSEFPSLGSRENNSAPNPALGARSNYGNFAFFLKREV